MSFDKMDGARDYYVEWHNQVQMENTVHFHSRII
jgi:hypothetical protein